MQKSLSTSASKNDKKLNKATSVFLRTQIIMLFSDILFLLVGSAVAYNCEIKQTMYFYLSTALFALVSFIAGYYSGFEIHHNGLVTGLIFCLPANMLIILISMILNHFKIDFSCGISFLIILTASMLGGILSVNTRKKAKTNRKGRAQ